MEDIKMTFNYNYMNMFSNGFSGLGFGNIGCGFGNIFGSGFSSCGSIFGNNIFYNSCNGEYNFDAMAGFALGNVFMQIGGNVLNQFIAHKQETSTKNVETNLENLNGRIDAILQNLGCSSVDEALSYNITDDPTSKKFKDLSSDLATKKVQLKALGNKNDYERIINEYKNAKSDDPNLEQLKQKSEDAEKALKSIEDVEAEIKELETQIVAADKAERERNSEIIKIQKELLTLNAERAGWQSIQDEQTLNKADGNKFNRVSTTELNDKFAQAEDGSYSTKAEASFTKRDFFTAVKEYKTASSDKKKEWKNKIKLIYDNMSGDEKSAKIVEAFDLIYPENKKS